MKDVGSWANWVLRRVEEDMVGEGEEKNK